jgi:hypothetical protein
MWHELQKPGVPVASIVTANPDGTTMTANTRTFFRRLIRQNLLNPDTNTALMSLIIFSLQRS